MRILVIGGTRFIGRAASEALLAAGHELLILHRGETEPASLAGARHLHIPRAQLSAAKSDIASFAPAVAVDTVAFTRNDADQALAVIPPGARTIVLSSCDVYRAYTSRDRGLVTDAVPLDESAPLRVERYPDRGRGAQFENYEKLDVEQAYAVRGATILRLGFIYGPHDPQRREEFILGRLRAGRLQIPFGPGTWLLSRCYVEDIATAIRLAVEAHDAAGEVFNLAEPRGVTVRLWAQQILEAAGSRAELVSVPSRLLPPDMTMSKSIQQHMLIDSSKARAMLGWKTFDPEGAIRASVAWHLANPPAGTSTGFSADDWALEGSRSREEFSQR